MNLQNKKDYNAFLSFMACIRTISKIIKEVEHLFYTQEKYECLLKFNIEYL